MSETIEVRIDTLVYGGDGLGRVEGRAVFVGGSAPGDLVEARVVERRKSYLRAEIVRIIEPGPSRRDAPCPYYGRCGGCQLQHVAYADQVAAKGRFVRDALERIGRMSLERDVVVAARPEHELGYRVRATAHLVSTRDGVLFGFHAGRSHRVVDVASCPQLVPELDAAWRRAHDARASLHRLDSLDLAAGDTGVAAAPPIAGIGGADLSMRVGDATYTFAPDGFFQANRFLLDALVESATRGDDHGALAVDLFAGVGLFTIPLARRYDRVEAVESNARAASLARANVAANDISNVDVSNETVESWLGRPARSPIDVVLLDPPRAGLGVDCAGALARLAPHSIVYVSCDPTTLARDVRVLVDAGYALESVEAFDLFPQTFHVETVARLSSAS